MNIFFLICKKPAPESLSPVSDAGFKALSLIHLITAAEDFAADVCCSCASDCDLMSVLNIRPPDNFRSYYIKNRNRRAKAG